MKRVAGYPGVAAEQATQQNDDALANAADGWTMDGSEYEALCLRGSSLSSHPPSSTLLFSPRTHPFFLTIATNFN